MPTRKIPLTGLVPIGEVALHFLLEALPGRSTAHKIFDVASIWVDRLWYALVVDERSVQPTLRPNACQT